jgi:hypothetical protein
MKKTFWIILLLSAAGFMACAHTGGSFRSASYDFTIEIPEGWRKIDRPYLYITKEDPFLQNMIVQNRPLGMPFRFTKKKINKNMLPEEAAQVIIDEIASDQNILNFSVLSNNPADFIYLQRQKRRHIQNPLLRFHQRRYVFQPALHGCRPTSLSTGCWDFHSNVEQLSGGQSR